MRIFIHRRRIIQLQERSLLPFGIEAGKQRLVAERYLLLFSGNPDHYLGGGTFQGDMVPAEQKEQVLSKKEPG